MRAITPLLLILICCACAGQEPIRVEVDLVNVAFSVRDSSGTLVNSLTQDDLEVFEDAIPQKIAFFARSADVPLTLGLIVDFSGSQENFIKQHHRDLEAFLKDVLGPNDRVFLVCFGNYLRLVSDLTPSGTALVEVMKEYEKGDRGFPQIGPREERELGTAFYDAIYYSITEKLASIQHGRRALILFSDGEDNSSAQDMMDAIEIAQSQDVRLYGIRYTESKKGHLNARNKYGIRVMDRIGLETGGTAFDARQAELRTHFRQIGEELHSSFELAYHTTNPERDGTFRKIVIRSKRPGLTVRAKTGYYAR